MLFRSQFRHRRAIVVQRYKLTGNGQSICYRNVEKLDLHRDLNRDLNRELHRELDRDVDSELNRDLERGLDRVSVEVRHQV